MIVYHSVSKEDLMATLKTFKEEVLISSKVIAELQGTQSNDLKAALLQVSKPMLKLKAEHSNLHKKVGTFKEKVASLDCNPVERTQKVRNIPNANCYKRIYDYL